MRGAATAGERTPDASRGSRSDSVDSPLARGPGARRGLCGRPQAPDRRARFGGSGRAPWRGSRGAGAARGARCVRPADVERVADGGLPRRAAGGDVERSAVRRDGHPRIARRRRSRCERDPRACERRRGSWAALARLASDPALRRTMGEAARARVVGKYAIEIEVRAHEALYEGLLGARETARQAA